MAKFNTKDLPNIGDVVRYETRGNQTLVLPVSHIEPQGGYTEVWLGEQIGRMPSNFNINHTTGLANTSSSEGGRWSIVRRAEDPKPTDLAEFSETVTDSEQDFAAELYELMGEHFTLLFFGRQRVVMAAIKAIREERASGLR